MWKIYSDTRSKNQRPVCSIFANSSSPCFRTDLRIVFFSCPCIILILSPLLIKITTGSRSCLISTLKNVEHGQCCCCSLQLICILDLCWHYFFFRFSYLLARRERMWRVINLNGTFNRHQVNHNSACFMNCTTPCSHIVINSAFGAHTKVFCRNFNIMSRMFCFFWPNALFYFFVTYRCQTQCSSSNSGKV